MCKYSCEAEEREHWRAAWGPGRRSPPPAAGGACPARCPDVSVLAAGDAAWDPRERPAEAAQEEASAAGHGAVARR
jgi:hypothetical protein